MEEKPVTWSGTVRSPLTDADVFPKTEAGLTTWVGVGGSPQSVVRTAKYGFPLMLAVIGGGPERFAPYIALYQRATEQFGTTAHPSGCTRPAWSPTHRRRGTRAALAALPGDAGPDRRAARLAPITRAEYEREIEQGSLYIGSPETVARKITRAVRALGIGRFDMIYGSGTVPVSTRLRAPSSAVRHQGDPDGPRHAGRLTTATIHE